MEPLPQELLNLEQQLRSFVPQAPQASPEQLLYQAGWEAALAQQSLMATTSTTVPAKDLPRARTTYYWAAACAALVLLSTALGWRVWRQPLPHSLPITTTTIPDKPPASTNPEPTLAQVAAPPVLEFPHAAEEQPSPLASYLELRHRVTRGGLSMWPVSTPVRMGPNDAGPTPARDWQAEILRETL